MSVEKAAELLDGQNKIWGHSLAYINTMTVQCAIELGIADVIHSHGRPITLGELVTALKISPTKSAFLARLMRMLVHLGYFEQQEERYGCSSHSNIIILMYFQFFVKDNPFNSNSFHLFINDPIMVKPWQHLSSWFRTNDEELTPFSHAHGEKRGLYDEMSAESGVGRHLNEAMGHDSSLLGKVLVVKCRGSFEGFNSVVDVGGNTGFIAAAIADAFPNIDCTVFDLPHVVSGIEGGGNLKFVGGDMFEEIPSADIVLFKLVLCDWGDESCVKILKQSKKAVTKESGAGKVMIIDHVLGHKSWSDHASTSTLLQIDLLEMACLEGTIKTEEQWAKLFSDAGFSKYTITPLHGLRALIEVYP
ncbi:Probable O-methyltransferase 3 [Linum perenne]